MNPDQLDRAIKQSAMEPPAPVLRPSPDRLEGDAKQAVLDVIAKSKLKVDPEYVKVHVIDFINFDEVFDYYLVNFYYEQTKDPTTYLECLKVVPGRGTCSAKVSKC